MGSDEVVGRPPGTPPRGGMMRGVEPVGRRFAVVTDLSGPSANASSRVQSVDRAVDLLRAVAAASGGDASVATLARHAGLNRATAWRILTTLEAQGMVSRDRHTGWYAIGPTFDELAA